MFIIDRNILSMAIQNPGPCLQGFVCAILTLQPYFSTKITLFPGAQICVVRLVLQVRALY